MIKITQKKDCCGCGACAQACPKACITMGADTEGFLYPVVDKRVCVDCGLCEHVCPILNKTAPQKQEVAAFAAYTKDEAIRQASSSGGIFSVLAEQILAQQGVVFGAAFAEDFSVHHIRIERPEELEKLRGSKYTQSRIENTYQEAKQALQNGKTVLFSGVGCQIAGLKAFLGKEYENLYTVDVLCHGVPSPKVWQKYVREQERRYGGRISAVTFRDKKSGWKTYSLSMDFQSGREYCEANSKNQYMRVFLSDLCLRPSCHSCRFKDIPRRSDLTIGDAWGIENHMPDMDDDGGTSVVLVHSTKGGQLWNAVSEKLNLRQGEVDILLPPAADSRKSVRPHPNRKRFFAALDRGADLAQLTQLTNKPLLKRLLSAGKRRMKRIVFWHS